MDKRTKTIFQKRQMVVFSLSLGVVTVAAGAALEFWLREAPFNTRIVTGFGIFLLGLGIAALTSYLSMRGDSPEAARLLNEEFDERLQLIKYQAGSRAYWVSMALAYLGLMWVSLASNGSLPSVSNDSLWWYLTVLVVLPFGVFAASLLFGQR